MHPLAFETLRFWLDPPGLLITNVYKVEARFSLCTERLRASHWQVKVLSE